MSIRPAAPDDVDAIADLAQDQRLRRQGRDPSLWPVAANARDLHRMTLRWAVESGAAPVLVARCDEGSLAAHLVASVTSSPADGSAVWVVDEMEVARPPQWDTLGRVLLAALGAHAVRRRVERVVVACPVVDERRRAALVRAGMDLNCWFRHVRLDGPGRSPGDRPVFDDDLDPGIPLPHLHSMLRTARRAEAVSVPGATAMLAGPVTSATGRRGETFALADPVVATGPEPLWDLLDAVEGRAADAGSVALMVAVGPGEEMLDRVLDERGYVRSVEWWSYRPTP